MEHQQNMAFPIFVQAYVPVFYILFFLYKVLFCKSANISIALLLCPGQTLF